MTYDHEKEIAFTKTAIAFITSLPNSGVKKYIEALLRSKLHAQLQGVRYSPVNLTANFADYAGFVPREPDSSTAAQMLTAEEQREAIAARAVHDDFIDDDTTEVRAVQFGGGNGSPAHGWWWIGFATQAEAEAAAAKVEKFDREKQTRIEYQNVVYEICLAVDRVTGRKLGVNNTTVGDIASVVTELIGAPGKDADDYQHVLRHLKRLVKACGIAVTKGGHNPDNAFDIVASIAATVTRLQSELAAAEKRCRSER